MSSELHPVRNGSEPIGRPPVCSDDELLALARRLHLEDGRVPTVTRIQAAGACQKARAVAGRRLIAQETAELQAREIVTVPPAVESAVRSTLTAWLQLATDQVNDALVEFRLEADERIDKREQEIEDLRQLNDTLARDNDELQRRLQNCDQQLADQTLALETERRESARYKAVASERRAMLNLALRAGKS